ncbi:MAG: type IV toxin-antitoxin system AbiEi family antitoxin domain-containing protein [Acidimicrobiia bacterium]
MKHIDRTATDLAVSQGGVITREQAVQLGFTPKQIKTRLRSGSWRLVKRSVYQLAKPRDRRDLMKTVLATWPGAVVSHESAADVHGFPFVKAKGITVSHHSRTTHDFPQVQVRRNHDLDDWHVTTVDGVRVTTVARTIVDLAADRSVRHIGAMLDRLVSDKMVDIFEVDAVLAATGRRGKPGTTTMREVLEARIGEDYSASELERRGRKIIRDAGLPMPIPEYPIPWTVGRRFDDAYPELKVAIEWDSMRYHGQRAAFEADRIRGRDATLNGWVILRFTWEDVHLRPHTIVEALRTLLAS